MAGQPKLDAKGLEKSTEPPAEDLPPPPPLLSATMVMPSIEISKENLDALINANERMLIEVNTYRDTFQDETFSLFVNTVTLSSLKKKLDEFKMALANQTGPGFLQVQLNENQASMFAIRASIWDGMNSLKTNHSNPEDFDQLIETSRPLLAAALNAKDNQAFEKNLRQFAIFLKQNMAFIKEQMTKATPTEKQIEVQLDERIERTKNPLPIIGESIRYTLLSHPKHEPAVNALPKNEVTALQDVASFIRKGKYDEAAKYLPELSNTVKKNLQDYLPRIRREISMAIRESEIFRNALVEKFSGPDIKKAPK